jgi:tRNA pseudouridine55 synthase
MSSVSADGILLIDKPKGWTSHDVVAKIRGMLRAEIRNQQLGNSEAEQIPNSQFPTSKLKVGHTGTLDPLATGLMIVVVGAYCKRAEEFSKLDKTYEVMMKLGEKSTTGDEEGVKTNVYAREYTKKEVQAALEQFQGEIMQVPPAFSAIKVDGKRAYKLAREGKSVKLEPRKVTIHNIELTDYTYPYVSFTSKVSSGTYIRSLVEDIGQKLGTGAYMAELRRTEVGKLTLVQAINIEEASINQITNIKALPNR